MNTFSLELMIIKCYYIYYGGMSSMNTYDEFDLKELKKAEEIQLQLESYIGKNIEVSFLNLGIFNSSKEKQDVCIGKLDDVYRFDRIILNNNSSYSQIEFAGLSQAIISIKDENGIILYYNSKLDRIKDNINTLRIFEFLPFIRRYAFGNILADADRVYSNRKQRYSLFYPTGPNGYETYIEIIKPYPLFESEQLKRKVSSF